MTRRLWLVPALAFMLCSGFICTGSQLHQAKTANADLATALNKGATTVIQLSQQGAITQAEENSILPKFYDATALSNSIEQCLDTLSTGQSMQSCVQPLLQSVQNDMTQASLGVKSPTASATMTIAINAVVQIFGEFVSAKTATQPVVSGGGN